MCGTDLIFDIGMHLGEDAEFYLRKGFRVVAVEADPVHCETVASRLADHVNCGRLTIVNAAVADQRGRISFYRNLDNSIWGTAEPDWVERNTRFGTRVERIAVDALPMQDIIATHGMPYYMKVDIEGRDLLCLEALRAFNDRPKYLSIEASKTDVTEVRAELDLMRALGYRDFKVVPQHVVPRQVPPNPSREGRYIDWRFPEGASGLFGDEAPGEWLDRDGALRAYDPIFRAYRWIGDRPVLPIGRFRGLLRRLGVDAGWHDTHARLGNAPA
ncbi:MAG TPA: FkbM family methyltransferase [Xanthobacteraceae bacterium]